MARGAGWVGAAAFVSILIVPLAVTQPGGVEDRVLVWGTLPQALSETSAVYDGNRYAYVFGGTAHEEFSHITSKRILRVDMVDGTVTTLDVTLPYPRRNTAAAWLDGKAYIIGGWLEWSDRPMWTPEPPNGPRDDILRFDPVRNNVTTMTAKLPAKVEAPVAVTVGNVIYIFGGRGVDQLGNDQIHRYDPATDSLTTLPMRLPQPRSSMSAAWTGSAVYLFGGLGCGNGHHSCDTVFEFRPSGGAYTIGPQLATPRHSTSAVWDGARVYVFGGELWMGDGTSFRDSVIAYNPATDGWSTVRATLPTPRGQTSAIWANGHAYVFGGYYIDEVAQEWKGSTDILQFRSSATPIPTSSAPPPPEDTEEPTASAVPAVTSVAAEGSQDQDLAAGGEQAGFMSRTTDLVSTTLTRAPPWAWLLGAVAIAGVPAGVLVIRKRRPKSGDAVAVTVQSAPPPRAPESAVALPATAGPPVLVVRNLNVARGKALLADAVSFELAPATLNILLGPSGSGKSTTLKAIVGLNPFEGDIRVANADARRDPAAIKKLLGYVPQELQLYENLSALQNIVYFGGQFGLGADESKKRGREILRDLGLAGKEEALLSRLSGGQRRRVSIAAAMVHQPKLLILDEPSSGLDFSSRKSLWDMLVGLAKNRGITVLATTHFIDEAQYADRVGIVFKGRLVAMGAPRELVEALPGEVRCVEIEFDRLEAADKQRLQALEPDLRARGLVDRAQYRMFSVRYFGKDPTQAQRQVLDALVQAQLSVRSSRLADVTLEDVFSFHTGELFPEAPG